MLNVLSAVMLCYASTVDAQADRMIKKKKIVADKGLGVSAFAANLRKEDAQVKKTCL